ncbi:hypothetical protein [Nonlabens ponticola]|uniref:Carboxypeptidase regulatory-like domain-containing protein n=1 Tax=Nonlabens ponticola TaxID=2496866 RepID=A0A3S9MUD4_9FLAO|nr:hypothetical protein [Nonlabens ponticola]AZQ42778.1 hypothetical protein EJ995_00455 [Nonlabens ponticola]
MIFDKKLSFVNKTFFSLLLFLCTLTTQAQVEKVPVSVFFVNCYDNELSLYFDNIEMISKETGIAESIVSDYGTFKFSAIPGNYVFKYKNIFDQVMETEAIISQEMNTQIKLCVDHLTSNNVQTLASKFDHGDKFIIDINSSGCFHNERVTFKFFFLANEIVGEVWNGEKLKKRKHLGTDIKEIVDFEKKVRLISRQDGGCTTTDRYTIKLNDQEYKAIDGSCSWNGMDALYKQLFL